MREETIVDTTGNTGEAAMNADSTRRLSPARPQSRFVPDFLSGMSGTDLLLLRIKMGSWIAPEIEAELDRRASGELPGPGGPEGAGRFSLVRRTHHRRRAPAA